MYHGIKILAPEAEEFILGSKIRLPGYSSTCKKFGVALDYAFKNLQNDRVAVIFEIIFKGRSGLFELTDDFTTFPGEEEVILQDGF